MIREYPIRKGALKLFEYKPNIKTKCKNYGGEE